MKYFVFILLAIVARFNSFCFHPFLLCILNPRIHIVPPHTQNRYKSRILLLTIRSTEHMAKDRNQVKFGHTHTHTHSFRSSRKSRSMVKCYLRWCDKHRGTLAAELHQIFPDSWWNVPLELNFEPYYNGTTCQCLQKILTSIISTTSFLSEDPVWPLLFSSEDCPITTVASTIYL